jgi:peroxiredoxin
MKTISTLGAAALLFAACGSSHKPETANKNSANANSTAADTQPAGPPDKAPVPAPDPAPAPAVATVGQMAPDFTLTSHEGKQVTLSSLRGKIVVLEWFNPGCPFIVYTHTKGALKQAPSTHDGKVVWLAINSNAPGKQGNGLALQKTKHAEYGMTYPILIDEDGKVGHLYEAKTTPHMFVIDTAGKLAYKGALDNAPFGRIQGGDTKVNYVETAVGALLAGNAPKVTETRSYGCSVKYAK